MCLLIALKMADRKSDPFNVLRDAHRMSSQNPRSTQLSQVQVLAAARSFGRDATPRPLQVKHG